MNIEMMNTIDASTAPLRTPLERENRQALDFRGFMFSGRQPYDQNLQMFVHQTREPDLSRLRFLRWLGEHGKLEHEVAGRADGEYAISDSPEPVTV
jgi:hypothetical protein